MDCEGRNGNACAFQVQQMLEDAKCDDVCTLDLRETCNFADYFVICTARSFRHVFTAANAVVYQVCTGTLCLHDYMSTLCIEQ